MESFDIDIAYLRLDPQEQEKIDMLANQMVRNIKAKSTGVVKVPFSFSMALELLLKVGVFLNKKEEALK